MRTFSKAFAKKNRKIAVLDLRKEAVDNIANEINATGEAAIGVAVNVLEKTSLEAVKKQ